MTKTDAIKERLKVDLEKLKITMTITVLLTGGLIGLLYRDKPVLLNMLLFIIGYISEIVCISYAIVLNNRINNLLKKMEENE